MKIVNSILQKYGTDKFLHMFLGGWLTALFGVFGLVPLLIGIIVVFLLSVIKEKLDGIFDWKDILFAEIGSGISTIICVISLII